MSSFISHRKYRSFQLFFTEAWYCLLGQIDTQLFMRNEKHFFVEIYSSMNGSRENRLEDSKYPSAKLAWG